MSKLIDEIRFTQELIKKPSVTPKDLGAMNVVVKHLKKLGFKCKLMSFQEKGTDKIINLYAKYGNQSPNLCFAGHTDVVPAGDVSSWSTNPFGAQIKKGYLYGRGVSDMKGDIGCFIAAVSQFLKENKNFKGSISFLITGDEESVAINGTKKVVEYLKKKKEKIETFQEQWQQNAILAVIKPGEPPKENSPLAVKEVEKQFFQQNRQFIQFQLTGRVNP